MRPFFWVAGLSATLFHSLHTGCCLITPPDTSSAALLRLIETEEATAVAGDDILFRAHATDPELTAAGYGVYRLGMDVAAVAEQVDGALCFRNPKPPGRQEPPRQYPTERFARSFGMTETLGAHTSLASGELLPPDRPRYCGVGVPGTIRKIVDPQTREPLPPGEVGELLVGGYCMMLGLYKAERNEVFTPDGLYATGDLCSIDAEGFLAFSARRGDMIKIHGANVAPLEVEQCLDSLPQVERSVVLAVEQGGEDLLVAAIQLRPGQTLDEAAARRELRSRLSSFKVPKRLLTLAAEEFPLTGSGKVKKSALREVLAARLAAEAAANPSNPEAAARAGATR